LFQGVVTTQPLAGRIHRKRVVRSMPSREAPSARRAPRPRRGRRGPGRQLRAQGVLQRLSIGVARGRANEGSEDEHL
jgi:hypothetical protein